MRETASKTVQYTVRGVSAAVDKVLRRKALDAKKSLNQVLVEALERWAGLATEHGEVRYHDLDEVAGKWVDDPEFDEAIAVQDRVDESLWK